ncbi:MAG: hypothetical protein ACTHK2_09840 [Dokdonella sp.]|uniref:hypothetical protein n=1 Tax=Dokdonella sp. TaxID=2291710 RepID=UPI003F80D11E
MVRWLLLAATILGFIFVFTTHSPMLLGIGLLLGIVGFIGFVFSLAAERVSANSRPETSMASPTDLAAMRKPAARPLPAPGRPPVSPQASSPAAAPAPAVAPPTRPPSATR